jgi:hypothetical protein
MAGEKKQLSPTQPPQMSPAQGELLPFEDSHLSGEFRNYYLHKRNNFFATVQAFPMLWHCFLSLDEIWFREFTDYKRISDLRQPFPLVFLMNAHAQYRTAFELGFSTRLGDAWNMLRSAIESEAHGLKIFREPQLTKVWLEKDDGKPQSEAFKDAFERNKKESLFPSSQGLEKLHHYYSQFSEWGTHTTLAVMSARFRSEESTTDVQWMLDYLETDPSKLATSLFSLLDASHEMEKAFFRSFEDRLKLDPTVVKMRTDFEKDKREVRDEIVRRFKLTPPSIWP